ncbi:unnamed protein product [Musa acuminata subsp. burmannicoides]
MVPLPTIYCWIWAMQVLVDLRLPGVPIFVGFQAIGPVGYLFHPPMTPPPARNSISPFSLSSTPALLPSVGGRLQPQLPQSSFYDNKAAHCSKPPTSPRTIRNEKNRNKNTTTTWRMAARATATIP